MENYFDNNNIKIILTDDIKEKLSDEIVLYLLQLISERNMELSKKNDKTIKMSDIQVADIIITKEELGYRMEVILSQQIPFYETKHLKHIMSGTPIRARVIMIKNIDGDDNLISLILNDYIEFDK